MPRKLILPTLLALLTLPALARAELVDNAFYDVWAKAKPGTAVTLKSDQGMPGGPVPGPEQKMVFRLISVAPDAAEVEVQSGPGDHREKLSIPKKCEKGEEFLSMMPKEQRADFARKSSSIAKDKITIDGKPADVTVYATSGNIQAGPENTLSLTFKIYVDSDRPGGFVRLEVSNTTQNQPGIAAPPAEIQSFTAVAWETPDKPAAAPAASQPAATQPKP